MGIVYRVNSDLTQFSFTLGARVCVCVGVQFSALISVL